MREWKPERLVELDSRAGASDTDREAWLAERAKGVTATEVRDLWLWRQGMGGRSVQELIDEKLGKAPVFQGNAYTEFGKLREPAIAAKLAGFTPESRVFHHVDRHEFLASPDAIALDFDERMTLAEIKTVGSSKYPLEPGSKACIEKGYVPQLQWQMFVCGADAGLLVVEERLGSLQEGFTPGELSQWHVPRDEEMIRELTGIADEFLVELAKAREAGGSELDEELDALAAEVIAGRQAEAAGKRAKETAWRRLQERVAAAGVRVSQRSERARVSWVPEHTVRQEVPDEDACRAANRDVWDELVRVRELERELAEKWDELLQAHMVEKEVRVAPRLTVTAPKKGEK